MDMESMRGIGVLFDMEMGAPFNRFNMQRGTVKMATWNDITTCVYDLDTLSTGYLLQKLDGVIYIAIKTESVIKNEEKF